MKCWEKTKLKTDHDSTYAIVPNNTFDEELSVTITKNKPNLAENIKYNQNSLAQTSEQYEPQSNYIILPDQFCQYYSFQTLNFDNQSSSLSSSSSSSLSSGSYSTSYQTNQLYYKQNYTNSFYGINDCSGIISIKRKF